MCSEEQLAELKSICPDAAPTADGPLRLIHLPKLIVTSDGKDTVVEALLCLTTHTGYPTRLFLSQNFPNRPRNWQTAVVLGRTWHTWSWTGISADQSPTQILIQHLTALR